jgi:hypothetical protein
MPQPGTLGSSPVTRFDVKFGPPPTKLAPDRPNNLEKIGSRIPVPCTKITVLIPGPARTWQPGRLGAGTSG